MRAVLCPVCNGKGTIYVGNGTTASGNEKTCHGCNGKGWVEVGGDEQAPYWYGSWYPGYTSPGSYGVILG